MKRRLLTAAIGLPIFAVIMVFYNTLVLDIAIAILCGIAFYEISSVSGLLKQRALFVLCLLFCVAFPFLRRANGLNTAGYIVLPVFMLLMFLIFLRNYHTLRIEQLCIAMTFSLLLPLAMCSLLYMRYDGVGYGLYYILITFSGSWLADAGAYFVGRAFGKHKLAPNISPKKTVEGAVGGIVFNVVCCVLVSLIYAAIHSGEQVVVYWGVILVAVMGAVLAIVGDLVFSLIKRQYSVKDFGTVLPGHGGILDRFDSVVFVAPFIYLVQAVFPLIH